MTTGSPPSFTVSYALSLYKIGSDNVMIRSSD
jgi:hypothetical protein